LPYPSITSAPEESVVRTNAFGNGAMSPFVILSTVGHGSLQVAGLTFAAIGIPKALPVSGDCW